MRLFRRKQQTTMPPEVAEYYQAERRDRRGKTWLMTLLALLITVAIVVGLFMAGRWLFRTIKGDDASQTATTQSSGSSSSSASNSGQSSADSSNSNKTDGSSSQSESDSSSSDSTRADDSSSSSSSSSSDTNTQGSDSSGNSSATDTGATNGTNDDLTNTGPGETTVVVFFGATVLGYLLYRRRLVHG